MNIVPHRGEIWWISLDPTKGSEIKKTRPCLVVSRNEYNKSASTITIIPITSGPVKYPAWEVEIEKSFGLSEVSHLVLPQIRVASKERVKRMIGKIPQSRFVDIEEKLLFYLGFDDLLRRQSELTLSGGGLTTGGFGSYVSS